MIQTFPPTLAGQTSAFAVADPKNVSFTGNVFEVRTGTDYVATVPLTADEQDRLVARAHVKLTTLKNMTPAQVQTWVSANVTSLAQAQDAIATLMVAVSILSRGL